MQGANLDDQSTITLTGANFQQISGSTVDVYIAGVKADSVTVGSDSSITAQFSLGVPIADGAKPKITFLEGSSSAVYNADPTTVTLTNAMALSSSSSGLQCSFAGGCLYEVQAPGLAQLLKNFPEKNYISVCDNVCKFSEADSSGTSAKCKLPQISTEYSNTNFGVA